MSSDVCATIHTQIDELVDLELENESESKQCQTSESLKLYVKS